MHNRLQEVQNQISLNKMERNEIAQHQYQVLKEAQATQKQKNLRRILKAYAANNTAKMMNIASGAVSGTKSQGKPTTRRIPMATF